LLPEYVFGLFNLAGSLLWLPHLYKHLKHLFVRWFIVSLEWTVSQTASDIGGVGIAAGNMPS
jgi:hypothetical protein